MRKAKFKAIGLLFVMLIAVGFTIHDVYISSMKMELIPATGELQLTLQVFTDDLESVLQSQSGEQIQLNPDRQVRDSLIASYLHSVLKLSIANTPIFLEYLGKEYRDDLTLLYMQAQRVDELSKMKLTHQLFLSELPTQQNLVHFKNNSYRKSFLFDAQRQKSTIKMRP